MTFVVDASAVIALLKEERADLDLATLVPQAIIASINLSEVVDRFARDGLVRAEIEDMLGDLELQVVINDIDAAWRAGMMRPVTDPFGLSLGDRFCIALAIQMDCAVLTTDRGLAAGADALGVEVLRAR